MENQDEKGRTRLERLLLEEPAERVPVSRMAQAAQMGAEITVVR